MAAKRRKLVSEDFDLGYGATTVPTDSGGTRAVTKTGIHTFMGASYLNARDQSGADLGAKINNAMTALAAISSNGVIDCRGFAGTQTAAATITLNSGVDLWLGAVSLTCSASPGILMSSASCIRGLGESVTDIRAGGNNVLLSVTSGPVTVCDLSMTGVSATYPTASGISITDGHSQVFSRLRMTDWGGVPFTVLADKGIFMMLTDSYIAPANTATTSSIVINGADTTPTHRHFTNVDTGGAIIDVQGAETTILVSVTAKNVTMTTSSKKLTMSACRLVSVGAATTINGINHSIVGNVIAGALTIGSSVQGSTIGPNVTVGAMTNSSTSTNNVLIDINSTAMLPKALRFVDGYGSVGPTTTDLVIGAGGTSPAAGSIQWGDGTAYRLNFGYSNAGTFTATAILTDVGGLTLGNGLIVNGNGVLLGSATGGQKGVGTINMASDIYKNNTAYTNPDYVFEKHFTGNIEKFAENDGAKEYAGLKPLAEVEAYAKEHFELPGVGKAEGMFERADVLLEKLEEAYLHIFELSKRIERLENK